MINLLLISSYYNTPFVYHLLFVFLVALLCRVYIFLTGQINSLYANVPVQPRLLQSSSIQSSRLLPYFLHFFLRLYQACHSTTTDHLLLLLCSRFEPQDPFHLIPNPLSKKPLLNQPLHPTPSPSRQHRKRKVSSNKAGNLQDGVFF